MPDVRIGISGWRYTPWRGDFYPDGLVQRRELEFASRAVNSIEINGSFYSLQTPERYVRWAADTPEGFVFSIKGPRFITHTRRLRDIHEPLANFFASGFLGMREKLGPILWQFPANFRYDRALFDDFLGRLPRDTDQAVKLARDCADRLKKPGYLDADKGQRLRHAVEVRSETFVTEDFVALLRKHNVALVVADTAGKWPYAEDLTADFLYIRLHGDKELYTSGYSNEALERWKKRIQTWTRGRQVADARLIGPREDTPRKERDVFCYFDNDVKVRAPYDARQLLGKLGLDKDLQATPGVLFDEEA
ncbi:Uncharacterized conserved protein YecE, DUF72 family [Halopseudomonas xinjiangensis]|uniref:Uncharacterized conserved protein YecE, DUF72 family n=1 Tax=Halopseudomonas xinjiangensis TaxID=487184 RepID=A0A1H1VC35_9GAMM|nr:DUF72 domain-containing protein [Halopseudomonas xinjiangensis]SDS81966.1 Uncharacterized conserved protein YecE, DUF72 family [Halopseudomonas xinjiangensis]